MGPERQEVSTHKNITPSELAQCIDHTLLKAEATRVEILRLCLEAREYGFHTVCTNGRWLPVVAEALHGTNVKVGGVVSLPLGAFSLIARLESRLSQKTESSSLFTIAWEVI